MLKAENWIKQSINFIRNEMIKNEIIQIEDENCLLIPENCLDLTSYFKSTFQLFIDPSIVSIQYTAEERILLIFRENLDTTLYHDLVKIEIYRENVGEDLDLEGIGCEKEFEVLISNNFDYLTECFYLIHQEKKRINTVGLYKGIEQKLLKLNPEFLLLFQLFGVNTKAYQWYDKQFSYQYIETNWRYQSHSFFTVFEDIKIITATQEPILRESLIQNIIQKLKNSNSNFDHADLDFNNTWEKIGYLAEEVSLDLALNEVNQIALDEFKKLEYSQRITIHYSLLDPSYLELDIDTVLKDVSELTSELIDEYIFKIANNITSVAKMEWYESNYF